MRISDDDILISRNGDGSITLSYLYRNRFIEHTYMFYSLREAKKLFKNLVKETISKFI
jgi:hypothetical protein